MGSQDERTVGGVSGQRSATGPLRRASVERVFVLGIDPGLSRCGYGAVRRDQKTRLQAVSGGVISTPRDAALPDRLSVLLGELQRLVEETRPDVVVVEHVFFQANARTAMSVGQASGIAMVAAAQCGCDVVRYTPNEVKEALVGYGSATKSQVQRMVASVLHLDAPPRPPDVADALALAVCHLSTMPLARAVTASLSQSQPHRARSIGARP
jgi:crossover junction endodeoxyribonuclease RuvC